MEKRFWENGISFQCTRCSTCCRYDQGYVFLYENDVKPILEILNLKYDDFIKQYCRWVNRGDGYEYLSLNEKLNYDCIFWDNGCTIYAARPLQCRTFPFWPDALSSLNSWLALTAGCKAYINIYNSQVEKHLSKSSSDSLSMSPKTNIPFFSSTTILEIRNKQLSEQKIRRAR